MLCLLFPNLWAQQENLVLNGSLEDTLFCPQNANILDARYWTAGVPQGLSSTDYFHACAGLVPVFGSSWVQTAYDGQAFIGTGYGIANFDSTSPRLREFASGALKQCLEPGKRYRFSFYANPPAHLTAARVGFDCFEVVFHTNAFLLDSQNAGVSQRYYEVAERAIRLPVTGPIIQRGIWHQLAVEFTATGDECYFTMGCFKWLRPENIDTLVGPGASGFVFSSVYYLYDAFMLTEIPDTTMPPLLLAPEVPNVITPNGDGINDFWVIKNLPAGTRVVLYNRWGQQVYYNENYSNQWNAAGLTSGTYMAEVLFTDWPAQRLPVFVMR